MKQCLIALIATLCVTQSIFTAPLQAETAEGNLRYSISVKKFKNEAGWSGRWNLGDGFTTIMTDVLNETGKFIVLGDGGMRNAAMAEQDFAASGRAAGGKKAPKVGRMTPAQLLVKGAITHVQNDTTGGGGGLGFKGIRVGGKKGNAEVNITILIRHSVSYVYQVATMSVIFITNWILLDLTGSTAD